jgi:hypothetical protein
LFRWIRPPLEVLRQQFQHRQRCYHSYCTNIICG